MAFTVKELQPSIPVIKSRISLFLEVQKYVDNCLPSSFMVRCDPFPLISSKQEKQIRVQEFISGIKLPFGSCLIGPIDRKLGRMLRQGREAIFGLKK